MSKPRLVKSAHKDWETTCYGKKEHARGPRHVCCLNKLRGYVFGHKHADIIWDFYRDTLKYDLNCALCLDDSHGSVEFLQHWNRNKRHAVRRLRKEAQSDDDQPSTIRYPEEM